MKAPGSYWFKGSHATGNTRFQLWTLVTVLEDGTVVSMGSDLRYHCRDLQGDWRIVHRPE